MNLIIPFVCLVVGVLGEQKELIMLEIQQLPEPAPDGKSLSKRSPQGTHYPGAPQIQFLTGSQQDQQIPSEYLSLLQGLQAQQGLAGQQVNPNDIQQVLISRAPQQFTGANSQPQAAARLTPQGEAQRRLQEIVQQKVIREQESRDTQRQQLRTYYQQQGIAIPVQGTALPVQGAFQLVQPTPGAFQFFQPQAHQLLGQPSQAYYTVGQQTEPEQVSYAQVQFGNTRQALAAEHREPKVQQEPRVVFTQPPQQVIYQVQRPTTTTEAPKAQPSPLPQQYLIETTKPQQVVSIPRERQPFVYFRPQATNREILAQFDQQQQEVPERPQAIPSRSSIYVSKASLGGAQKPVFLNAGGQGRVATPQGQRPLTQIEFKALTDAGFKVASQPVDAQDFLSTAYTTAPQRASLKRPNKRVPKPVPLSFEERQRLAQQGIRNLYKVETAESQNSPVTYVLALGKTNTESS